MTTEPDFLNIAKWLNPDYRQHLSDLVSDDLEAALRKYKSHIREHGAAGKIDDILDSVEGVLEGIVKKQLNVGAHEGSELPFDQSILRAYYTQMFEWDRTRFKSFLKGITKETDYLSGFLGQLQRAFQQNAMRHCDGEAARLVKDYIDTEDDSSAKKDKLLRYMKGVIEGKDKRYSLDETKFKAIKNPSEIVSILSAFYSDRYSPAWVKETDGVVKYTPGS